MAGNTPRRHINHPHGFDRDARHRPRVSLTGHSCGKYGFVSCAHVLLMWFFMVLYLLLPVFMCVSCASSWFVSWARPQGCNIHIYIYGISERDMRDSLNLERRKQTGDKMTSPPGVHFFFTFFLFL